MLQVQPNVFTHFACVAFCPHSIATAGQWVIWQITLPVLTRVPRLRPSRFHLWPILRLNLYFVFNIRSKKKLWPFLCDFVSMFQIRACNGKNNTKQAKKRGAVRSVAGRLPPKSHFVILTLLSHPSNSILKTTRLLSIIRICILRVITYKNHYTLEMISLGKFCSSVSLCSHYPSLLFFQANKQTPSGNMAVKQSSSGNCLVL